MSIVSVNKTWTGRGGTDTYDRKRSYREVWEVVTNNPLDDEEIAAGAPAALMGLPRLGQPHERFPFAVCVEIDAAQSEDSPFHWAVNVRYESNPQLPNGNDPDGNSQSPGEIPENPLLRPPTWEVSFESTTEPARFWLPLDSSGNVPALPKGGGFAALARRLMPAGSFIPVRNSAGLPFDPPLEVEVSRPVWRVTKNVRGASGAYLLALENAINDREWRGIPKWCCKTRGTRASNKFENGVSFVELTVEIAIKNETWLPEILDAGLHARQKRDLKGDGEVTETWTQIRDPFNSVSTDPQPLDGKGQPLKPGAEPVFLRGLSANFQLRDFATLLGF